MPPSCLNVETSWSTFATSARNTCNILMKHLKHVEHKLVTCTNPATRHECLLIAATACPLPRAIPLLLNVEGAARRRGSLASPRAPCTGAVVGSCAPRAQPCRHWGKGRRWGGAHSPESRVFAERRGAAPPRYPDEGAVQRVHGELRPSHRWAPRGRGGSRSSTWGTGDALLPTEELLRRCASPGSNLSPWDPPSMTCNIEKKRWVLWKKSSGKEVAERRCRRRIRSRDG
jgi:hypothetical protein